MASLAETLETLKSLRSKLPQLPQLSSLPHLLQPGRLTEAKPGLNPGALRMMTYIPEHLPRGVPLVVALHGCGQTAGGYDAGTGWSQLADRAGFALLCPEQVRGNNANTCFNWFEPGDVARGAGEVASVAAMAGQMVAEHGLDRRRVFVTGLSAGGAMTTALLACYPDVFAGGAIIAGLPFGLPGGVPAALGAMHRGHVEAPSAWGDKVRAASPHRGPWPRVSVWHGTADHTVIPSNADELVKQWTDVHGAVGAPRTMPVAGGIRQVWTDRAGRTVLEQVMVPGLGHGVPIAPAAGGIGAPAPFILASGISSTENIARFFGVLPPGATAPAPPAAEPLASRLFKLPGLLRP